MALMPDRQTLLMVIAGTCCWDARLDRGLARGDLPGARLQDLTHDHVVDVVAFDAGPVNGGPDGVRAQARGRDFLEGSAKLAERRSGACNDYRSHKVSLVTR